MVQVFVQREKLAVQKSLFNYKLFEAFWSISSDFHF